MSYATLIQWPLVAELVSEKYISLHTLQQLFLQACTHNDANTVSTIVPIDSLSETSSMKGDVEAAGLDLSGFNVLLDLLLPYASDDSTDHTPIDVIQLQEKEVGKVEHSDMEVNKKVLSTANKEMSEEVQGLNKEVFEEVHDEEEQLTRTVFQDMAGAKGCVSLKDLLRWDFVYTLLAEVSRHLLPPLLGV